MSSVVRQSEKLRDVLYDIRGPVNARAAAMEAAGERILKLNIGNPQPFGFDAPTPTRAASSRHDARSYTTTSCKRDSRSSTSTTYGWATACPS